MGWGIKQPGLRFLSPTSGHVPGTDLGPATSLWHRDPGTDQRCRRECILRALPCSPFRPLQCTFPVTLTPLHTQKWISTQQFSSQ